MRNGIAIALAWPQTLCKNAGAWYDTPMKWLGLNKFNYYRVGHAAIVLIKKETGECYYFDFGRYHALYQHGRVRSAFTDHDLAMNSKAVIEDGRLCNYTEILYELYRNTSCHGDGNINASYCEIEFEKAYAKAISMQAQSPIQYGPFLPKGTNCSRFVNTVILSGNPKWFYKLMLAFRKTLSPTPLGTVKLLHHYTVIGINRSVPKGNFNRIRFYNETKTACHNVLPPPAKPAHLPSGIQWLSGEGCGSWFHIGKRENGFLISRYNADGKLECSGLFRQASGQPFKIEEHYSYTYLSHCAEVNIIQDNQKLNFQRNA